MPTARNARGIDIVAYDRHGKMFRGIQVKTLSRRPAVPLGGSIDKVMGDFWIIVNQVTANATAFILRPAEVKRLAVGEEKDGRTSFWLSRDDYESEGFREAWDRIGRGDGAGPARRGALQA